MFQVFVRFNVLFFVALLSSPLFAQNDEAVLARIGRKTLTVGEFKKRFEQNVNLSPGEKPSKQEVLKNIIYFELATQEARNLKLDQDPGVRDQIDILLYQELVRKKVQPDIDNLKVSEAEVQAFYKENPLLRTRHIVFLTRADMDEARRKSLKARAEEIRQRALKAPSSFSDLAKEYSEGPSAKTGGDVDWGAPHKLLAEYYQAALRLKNSGDISPVVETPYGYHIIQLQGVKEYKDIDSTYKNYIVRALKERRGKGVYDAYFESLKSKSSVSVNESLL